jgi:hypothetical protein
VSIETRQFMQQKLPSKVSYGDKWPPKGLSSEGECIRTKGAFSDRDEQCTISYGECLIPSKWLHLSRCHVSSRAMTYRMNGEKRF